MFDSDDMSHLHCTHAVEIHFNILSSDSPHETNMPLEVKGRAAWMQFEGSLEPVQSI